jgi:hypothetical protein
VSQEAIPGNDREPDRPEDALPAPPGSGPDDALILWMLSLTPIERLAVAQGFMDSTYALRNGKRS